RLEKELTEKQKLRTQAEKHYKVYETLWLENQAVVLASELHEGDPCPVCGSTHHPNKKLTADGVSRVELDKRKAALDAAENVYRDTLNDFNNQSNQLNRQAQEVSHYGVALEHVLQETEKVIERGKAVKKDIEQLKELAKQVEQTREQIQKLEDQVKREREEK